LISLADTPYYHITSRCVPKALRGAGSTPGISLWGGPLLRSKLRAPTAMDRRPNSTALLALCHRRSESMDRLTLRKVETGSQIPVTDKAINEALYTPAKCA
jgi:hypothetical protein